MISGAREFPTDLVRPQMLGPVASVREGPQAVDCCSHSMEELGLDVQTTKDIMMPIAKCACHALTLSGRSADPSRGMQ